MRNSYASFLGFALVFSAAVLAACGGSQPAPSTPAPDTSTPKETTPAADAGATSATGGGETPAPAAKSGFDALSADKKVEVMATKVVPNVGKLFKEHDSAKFGKFGCATCHGPKKDQDPKAFLPKLTLSNGGFEKLAKAKPEMVKFMAEKVTPAMASALGEKPFDPATHTGFGCNGCHAVE
jgi:cytochrome c551/c552